MSVSTYGDRQETEDLVFVRNHCGHFAGLEDGGCNADEGIVTQFRKELDELANSTNPAIREIALATKNACISCEQKKSQQE